MKLSPQNPAKPELVESLLTDADLNLRVLRDRAKLLEQEAGQLRQLAQAVHYQRVEADLAAPATGSVGLVARQSGLSNSDMYWGGFVSFHGNAAAEIWLSFATRGVLPVTVLDGKPVGTGKPGPLFRRMRAAFVDFTRELAGTPAL